MSILTWDDLYRQLWTQAAQSRGTVTDLGPPLGIRALSGMSEWPRTTGADAIAIAALVDPILAALQLRPGGYGITQLWRSAVVELDGVAYASPAGEYAHNRSLWAALLAVASYLDTMQARLPDEESLEAIVAALWSPAMRSTIGTAQVVDESSPERMWTSQHAELVKLRGFDLGTTGSGLPTIPRTTNDDVIRIADYWEEQLAWFGIEAALGNAGNTMGLQGQLRRWSTIADDVDKIARTGPPDGVYPKNAQLWQESMGLATNLAVWGMGAPAAHRNAGTRVIVESSAEKMWTTQHAEQVNLRGFDPGLSGALTKVPRSTNADAIRIADYWGKQLGGFVAKAMSGSAGNTMGLEGQLKRWSAIAGDIDQIARKGAPGDVYPKNAQLWRESMGLATNLAVWGETPTAFELAFDSAKQAVIDLPGRLADAAAAAGHAVGKVAHDIGAGFFSSLGKPLLIGGAAVVGLLVVLRLTRSHEATPHAA